MALTKSRLAGTDKAYRTAVFDLESHRLNINKIVMHANEVSWRRGYTALLQSLRSAPCRL